MEHNDWFAHKWLWLRRFALLSLVGLPVLATGGLLALPVLAFPGLLALFPLLLWLALIPVLHWKDRYRGRRSTLWGGLLAFEVTGWSKLAYWLRHVWPDWRQRGRYRDAG